MVANNKTTLRSFANIAAWKASAEFQTSKGSGSVRAAYSPGIEGNSTDAKPTMPSLDNFPADRFKYRPSPTSAVTVATSASLSGANWWSASRRVGARQYFPWNDGSMTLRRARGRARSTRTALRCRWACRTHDLGEKSNGIINEHRRTSRFRGRPVRRSSHRSDRAGQPP